MRAAAHAAIIAAMFGVLLYTHNGCASAPRSSPPAMFGRVRNAATGEMVAGAEIAFYVQGEVRPYSTWSRRDGSYVLPSAPVGYSGMLRCTKRGFRDYVTSFTLQTANERVDIELTPE